jgi:hypothetical protein
MNRARPFRAVIAALALLAFVPESVWAAACLPGMDTAFASAAAAAGTPAHPAGHGDAAPATGDAGPTRSGEHDDPAHHGGGTCPFTAGSGCVAASLPSSGAVLGTVFPGSPSAPLVPRTGHERLLVTILFHPPRA